MFGFVLWSDWNGKKFLEFDGRNGISNLDVHFRFGQLNRAKCL